MKDTVIPLESLEKAVLQGRRNGCNELVISGGEPTLAPEAVMELISLAEASGYQKYIIQTNGYGLSRFGELVSFLDRAAETAEICLSFSVHGHIADVHNELSGNPDAFAGLMDAMDKVSATHCRIYTNTVINARNVHHLGDVAALLAPYRPDIMQFSVMHSEERNELSVSLEDCVWAIRKLKRMVSPDRLKTEGVPYCLLHGMETCVGESAWPSVLDLYNREDEYMSDFKQLDDGMRRKMENCDKCVMDQICMGVWKEHFEEFSHMGIHPIR